MSKVSKLVLDAGPLINLTREEIVSQGDQLYATPAVIKEIKDEDARRRLELLKDEIQVVQPNAHSVKFATDFAKLTGDGLVLSVQDIEVIALAYELVEDKSRLRTKPAVSGNDNTKKVVVDNENTALGPAEQQEQEQQPQQEEVDEDGFIVVKPKAPKPNARSAKQAKQAAQKAAEKAAEKAAAQKAVEEQNAATEAALKKLSISEQSQTAAGKEDEDSDWSDDDWISPENVEEKLKTESTNAAPIDEDVEVAIASRDYAVQNTALQIGLCAVNERGLRIKQLRNYMQRCYACFKLLPLDGGRVRQFCPQCGGHTLTRVSTSVDKHGQLHVHLKAKMQWITRGDRYNVPNPQSRRARRQQHDTKKEFYAEDQPEYIKAMKKQHWQQRRNERMVAEYVGPSTVDSAMSPFAPNREMTGRVQIGRGRYANSTGKKTAELR